MSEQLNMFDTEKVPFKFNKPIRLIELFSGIGCQAAAFERLGVNFEPYRTSEWEYHAVLSYDVIHPNPIGVIEMTDEYMIDYLFTKGISSDGKTPMTREQVKKLGKNLRPVYEAYMRTNNIGSICNAKGSDLGIVDTDKYTYFACYSFPCTDLSNAGLQNGMSYEDWERGESTRSGLLWEVKRLLEETENLPQVLLMENVPQVHSAKHQDDWNRWLKFLESKGYSNYYKDLNAKDFGIPQNRNRTYMISLLGDYTYEFPKPIELTKRLKDCLDDVAPETFYLSEEAVNGLVNQMSKNTSRL